MNIALERLHAQRLAKPLGTAVEVVTHLLAVQSQDYAGARWAVGRRMRSATDDLVSRAFDDGEILRTHVMRPTWHFVAPADLRWLLALTAPRVQQFNASHYKQHGLTARSLAATDTKLADALRGGTYLTRDELAKAAGVKHAGTALACVVMHAELEAAIVSGPRRGKQFTYAAFDERVSAASAARTRDDMLAELARRYVTSHGPAQVQDLAWWSGLTQKDARRGMELAELVRVELDGVEYFRGAAERKATLADPTVHLLPNYDELLIAFADRSAARDPRVDKMDSGVFAHHFVLSNGRLVGGYRRVEARGEVIVECTLVAQLTAAEQRALDAEVARFAAFLAMPARLEHVTARTSRRGLSEKRATSASRTTTRRGRRASAGSR